MTNASATKMSAERPQWTELEAWLLERQTETGDARYQDAATLLRQQRKLLSAVTPELLEQLAAEGEDNWLRDVLPMKLRDLATKLRELTRLGLVERKRHWVGLTGGHWRYRRKDTE